jgi:hypothetical protein
MNAPASQKELVNRKKQIESRESKVFLVYLFYYYYACSSQTMDLVNRKIQIESRSTKLEDELKFSFREIFDESSSLTTGMNNQKETIEIRSSKVEDQLKFSFCEEKLIENCRIMCYVINISCHILWNL